MKIKKESMKSIPRWLTLCAVPGSCMNIPIYLLLSIPPLVAYWGEWLEREHFETLRRKP